MSELNKKWFTAVEITLPLTKVVIEFSEYLTTDQSRQLQRTLLKTDIPLSGDMDAKNISSKNAEGLIDMQEQALSFLFRKAYEVIDSKKEEIPAENAVDFVGSLPSSDGIIVYEAVGNIMSGSKLDKDSKKN